MKTLVMCLADPSGNPRPNRLIHLLKSQGHTIDVLSYPVSKPKLLPVYNFYDILPKIYSKNSLFIRNLKRYYNILGVLFSKYITNYNVLNYILSKKYNIDRYSNALRTNDYRIIFVEDLSLLPFAFQIKNRATIIFDAREYYPKQLENNSYFKRYEYPVRVSLCNYYLKKCDYLFTVSPGLAKAYRDEFGVKMEVLRSTPQYQKIQVKETTIKAIRMVHHGGAHVERSLWNMVEIVKRLDNRFTLDLYLVGHSSDIQQIKEKAMGCDRINFYSPVSFDNIIQMLNEYDIGFYYLEPAAFNITYNLPNKFFEFIQARLAIAIGPSPDMAHLVNKYKCGFISPDFSIDSMIKTLQALTPEMIDGAKLNSDKASSILCYEKESKKLLELIQSSKK